MTKSANERQVDVAILGAGSAGLSTRRAAKAAGASVALIDPGPFGTTCARVGCMPSKLLIHAAHSAHQAREAHRFGVHTDVRVDGAAVLKRLRSERDRFVGFVLDVIEQARSAGELIQAKATIESPGVLALSDGSRVRYRSLVLATGSKSSVPPDYRALGPDRLLTNESVFELEQLPGSLLVVGAGVLGLELGQAFARLGVRTTILGTEQALGPLSDPDVRDNANKILCGELDLHTTHALQSVEQTPQGVRVRFRDRDGNAREELYERVLMGAGRPPVLDGLGIDKLGVSQDDKGRFPIDAHTLQLADQPVFVAGDANGLHPILHEASDDGQIAGTNAARFPKLDKPPRRTPLAIMFSDPQVAVIGTTYAKLSECTAMQGEVDFGDQGRARVQGENRGKLRIYADRDSHRLIGAELIAPQGEHLAQLLAWAIQRALTVEEVLALPFYHPVVEEGVRSALRDLAKNLRCGEPIKCRVSELGVGS
jgi:dihydrolipoamide dehydrogenase